jgi:cytochrome P450
MKHHQLTTLQALGFFRRSNDRSKTLGEFQKLHLNYGDIIEIKRPLRVFLINSPKALKHILHDNQDNFPKSPLYKKIEFIFGEGLLSTDGEKWRKSRSSFTPSFSGKSIGHFIQNITNISVKSNDRLLTSLKSSSEVDFNSMISIMSLKVIDDCLFGGVTKGELSFLEESLNTLLKEVVKRLRNPIRGRFPYLYPSNKNITNIIKRIDSICYNVVHNAPKGSPFYQVKSLNNLDQKSLRNEILTLFLAGYETSANAMTWTIYCLLKNPQYISKLRNERNVVLGNKNIDADSLQKMPWLKSIIEESMRLFPPVPSISKMCLKDDIVEGVKIPAGSIIGIHQYIIHRDKRFWDSPNEFKPCRFHEKDYRNTFTYFPYSKGKRACMGDRLANIEMMIFISDFVNKFDFQFSDSFVFKPIFNMTLSNSGGLPLVISERISE